MATEAFLHYLLYRAGVSHQLFYISSYVSWNISTFENTRDTVAQNEDSTLKRARGVEKHASP